MFLFYLELSASSWLALSVLYSYSFFIYVQIPCQDIYILSFFFQFINHLINQLARHQFLKIACLLEKKTMVGAYSLLKVIESELQGYLSATRGRVVLNS